MLRLFAIFSRFRNLILFLGLELIAFFLIVRINDRQRHLLGDVAMVASARVYNTRNTVGQYFGLVHENEQLQSENIQLRSELVQTERILDSLQQLSGLQLSMVGGQKLSKDQEDFRLLKANVIKNSTNKIYNYLTLNKGTKDGVGLDMGVVSPLGIVGRVIRVNESYSLVLSALNVDLQLPVKVLDLKGQEVSNIGFYEWRERDPMRADLTYVPETVDLKEGYSVVTSGYSTIFPPDYQVGTIEIPEEYQAAPGEKNDTKAQDGFHQAKILLATPFHLLGNVYLIEATHKDSLQNLEINLPKE
ncbi:MAG: rod shape-determining protein MreC [Bacteroidota bacterium]